MDSSSACITHCYRSLSPHYKYGSRQASSPLRSSELNYLKIYTARLDRHYRFSFSCKGQVVRNEHFVVLLRIKRSPTLFSTSRRSYPLCLGAWDSISHRLFPFFRMFWNLVVVQYEKYHLHHILLFALLLMYRYAMNNIEINCY